LEYDEGWVYDEDIICGKHYVVVECEVVGYGLFCEWPDLSDTYLGVELKPISDVPDWWDSSDWHYDFGEVNYVKLEQEQSWLRVRYKQWEVFKNNKKEKV